MFRQWTIGVLALLLLSLGALASCAGDSAVTADLALSDTQVETDSQFAGLPAIPMDDAADAAKAASWLGYVNPQTPLLSHRAYNCAVHSGCEVLEGLHGFPLTHMPAPPYFAYALYEAPLGAAASDLLTVRLEGEMEAAGQSYFIAMANYDAMAWEFFGPATTGDYTIDMPALGYDFTSAAGNMYLVVLVPQEMLLHLKLIELDFDGAPPGTHPAVWNVWGEAHNDYALGTMLPGETVTFVDLVTSVNYATTTGRNGGWGMNLPDGTYEFNVTNSQHFFDPAAMMIIESLPVRLELNAGNFIYHGPNAAYDGTIIPMPLITLNAF
jgi:hypothetical protein